MTSNDRDPLSGCQELHSWTRREFLSRGTLAGAAAASAPLWMPSVSLASPLGVSQRDVLVFVFLRGGMDGLTTLVPWGDPFLYGARPTLAVPPPGGAGTTLDLDGFFGLPPAAAPLLVPYGAGKLAFVHAAGSTDPTRSHFDAFQHMELGIPNLPLGSQTSGWLARHLQATAALDPLAPLRGVAATSTLPMTLAQSPKTLPIANFATFAFPGSTSTAPLRAKSLANGYAAVAPPLGPAALDTLSTIDLFKTIDFAGYAPSNGAVYPSTTFGTGMKSIAALIKADVGVEAMMIERGGWDLHNNLGPLAGAMASLLDEVSNALLALYLDLATALDRVTLLVMSEFGRRVQENGSAGVDHGHGNAMLVMGGHVNGGQVHGTWPTLAPAALDQGDLAVTTDFRDVVGEILVKRCANTNLSTVFPSYTPQFPGIVT